MPAGGLIFLMAVPRTERDVVEAVVQAAARAPSLHNSQPWHFVARERPSGDIEIDLYVSHDRELPAADPDGRELHIACGAALELGRLETRALGRAVMVDLLPAAHKPELLGRLLIGGALPAQADEIRLAGAIPKRYTAREMFDPRPLAGEDLDALCALASVPEVWIKVVDQPEDEVWLAVLLGRADDIEATDPHYVEELSSWRREDDSSDDGIPARALGSTPVEQRASSLRLRNLRIGAQEDGVAVLGPPVPEHPLPVIIGTAADDRRSWLTAGQVLGRILLEATCRGIGASPMTQVLEIAPFRSMLTSALGLIGHPQMLLRLGYEAGGSPTSRRQLSDVLRFE